MVSFSITGVTFARYASVWGLYAPSTLRGNSATTDAAYCFVETAVHSVPRASSPAKYPSRPGFPESRTRSWMISDPVTTTASKGMSSGLSIASISEKREEGATAAIARHVDLTFANSPQKASLSRSAPSASSPKSPMIEHDPGVPVFASITSVATTALNSPNTLSVDPTWFSSRRRPSTPVASHRAGGSRRCVAVFGVVFSGCFLFASGSP
mmetsp:Transcript_4419/g.14733  ORF Transcript_4419/g.14733 Transcript_4419/m.14733 type:complete len:211 (-) Transcript_4419:23-655(-)